MAARGVYSRGVYSRAPQVSQGASHAGAVAAIVASAAAAVPVIARASVLLPEPVAEAGERLAAALGKHPFHGHTLVGMAAAMLTAVIFAQLHGRRTKLVFSLCAGILLCQLTCGPFWLIVLAHSAVAFALVRATAPGSRLALQGGSRGLCMLGWMVAMVLVVSVVKVHVLQLDASHQWYSRFEYTIGGMMFVTLKVTAMTWSLHDGQPPQLATMRKELPQASVRRQLVLRARLERVATAEPSALEYWSFVFSVPSVAMGQPMEYAEYLSVCDGSRFRTDLDNGLPPQRWVLVAKKLAVAAVFLGIHLWGYDRLNFNITLNSSDIAAARASVGGFCMHVARVYAAGFFVRCMFYTVSFCTDAISIVAGFGYRGCDSKGRDDWSGSDRMDVLGVEFAPHVVILARSWNKTIHGWAKRDVHERTGRTVMTFAIVGLLHGVDPGKLIWCCSWVPVGLCVRLIRWRVRPWLLTADGRKRPWLSRLYTAMGYLATSLLVVYGHASYFMTDVETTMRAYSSFMYLGHIITIGAIPILWMLPVPKWASKYKGDMKGAVVGTLQTKVVPAEKLFYSGVRSGVPRRRPAKKGDGATGASSSTSGSKSSGQQARRRGRA